MPEVEFPLDVAELLFDGVAPEAVAPEDAASETAALGAVSVTCTDVDSGRLSLNFPVERFEIGVWIYPRRFLGSIDNKRSNNNDNGTDNQYGEPNSVATCRDLAGRDEAEDKGKQ